MKENSSCKTFVQEKFRSQKCLCNGSQNREFGGKYFDTKFQEKNKETKKFRTKINTGKLEKREGGKVEQETAAPVVRGTVAH